MKWLKPTVLETATLAAILALLFFMLAGCEVEATSTTAKPATEHVNDALGGPRGLPTAGADVYLWTAPNGCQYLLTGRGAITPYMGRINPLDAQTYQKGCR